MTLRTIVTLTLMITILTACGGNTASVFPYAALPPEGDIANGELLYFNGKGNNPACSACHVAGAAAAPSLEGYGDVAATRVEGQDAREYTFYAIAEPAQYIVEGYGNAMWARYDDNLTPQEVADLVDYILSDEFTP
ncbi:MAG: c-type cytochrome [Chloroflexota bacterium]